MKKTLPYNNAIALLIMSLMIATNNGSLQANKENGYTKKLEAAFAAKIAREKKTNGMTGASAENDMVSDLFSDKKNQIGPTVVGSINNLIKSPAIDLVASTDFTSWATLSKRFERLKKSLEIFETKYKGQLQKPIRSTTMAPMPIKKQPMPKASMPGVTIQVKKAPLSSIKLMKKPIPAMPSASDQEEGDDEEIEEPAMATLPPLKPIALPKPASLPSPPKKIAPLPSATRAPLPPIKTTLPKATTPPTTLPKPSLPGGMPAA